jgi:hypothetical protein
MLDQSKIHDLSQFIALRLPNLTTTQRDAIASPTSGMVIYNTTTTTVNQYNGSWGALGGSGASFDDAEGDPVDTSTAAAADGTSTYAARRDHRHHLGIHTHRSEVLMQDGVTSPPVPLETEDETDWLYEG